MNNQQISFSHRPKAGVSIGIYVEGRNAYLAASFTRRDKDPFSRDMARRIIRQRLDTKIHDRKNISYVTWMPLNGKKDQRSIMKLLRPAFKPDPFEEDSIFDSMQRKDAWKFIEGMFQDVMKLEHVQ